MGGFGRGGFGRGEGGIGGEIDGWEGLIVVD